MRATYRYFPPITVWTGISLLGVAVALAGWGFYVRARVRDGEIGVGRGRLHPLAVEDALSAHQMPKVEAYEDELFVVARTAELKDDRITYGETHVFVGANHIITVRHGSAKSHAALRRQLEASPRQLRHGPDFVLHAILDFVVDGYGPIMDKAEDRALEMEREALDAFLSRLQIKRLFRLRRQLLKFRRILGPMEDVGSKLETLDLPCIDPEVRPYFRDLADHARRVNHRAEGLGEALGGERRVSDAGADRCDGAGSGSGG